MKTRNGFVSNSSSSSFIVNYKTKDFFTLKVENHLTKDQHQLLLDNGFRPTNCRFPDQILPKHYKNVKPKPDVNVELNLAREVTCNQDDIIYILLKNKIKFIASVHYDQETYIYKGGKYMYEIRDVFNSLNMTRDITDDGDIDDKRINEMNRIKPIRKISVKDWIKNEEKNFPPVDIT